MKRPVRIKEHVHNPALLVFLFFAPRQSYLGNGDCTRLQIPVDTSLQSQAHRRSSFASPIKPLLMNHSLPKRKYRERRDPLAPSRGLLASLFQVRSHCFALVSRPSLVTVSSQLCMRLCQPIVLLLFYAINTIGDCADAPTSACRS